MGLLFAVLSALCSVVLDVLRKVLGQRFPATLVAIGISLGAASMYATFLALSGGSHWDRTFVAVVSLQATFNAVASVLVVRAVTLSPLSLTVPYLGFTPVVTAGVAAAVLHEVPSLRGLAGIGFVVIGAVALHSETNTRVRDLFTAPVREPGSWRMLTVAVIWGITTPLSKIAIAHGSEVLLALCLATGSSTILAGAWFSGVVKNMQPRVKKNPTPLLFCTAALAAGGAVLFEFFAYRELLVAYVETIRRSGSLLSIVTGALVFHEDGLARRLPAAAIMVLGVALVVLR